MSKTTQEVEVPTKNIKKQEPKEEQTIQGKFYIPPTDIVETEKVLRVIMDMPGVHRENISVNLEKDVLKVEGLIDSSPYLKANPLYTEYNVGHYTRSFNLSKTIDQEHIEASLNDGVLTLVLPKAEEAQPRQIAIH